MSNQLYDLLASGDKRTVKNVNGAVALLESEPGLVAEALELIEDESAAVAMRAADCLEKLSRKHPEHIQGYSDELMAILLGKPQKEVRWHLAQILPRLQLSNSFLKQASEIWLSDYYASPSSIVRAESLQALHSIRQDYPEIAPDLQKAVLDGINQGTPAVKARAKALYAKL